MLQKNGYPGKKDQSNTWLLSFLALVPCCWDTSFPCVYCVPGRTTFCVVPRGIACLVHGYNPLSWMVAWQKGCPQYEYDNQLAGNSISLRLA